MKKQMQVLLAALLAAGLLFNSTPAVTAVQGPETAPQPTVAGEFAPGRLLVRFKDGIAMSATANALADYGATSLGSLYASPVQLLQVPAGQELALMERLKADARVEYAEPDSLFHTTVVPNDPSYGSQWGLPKIEAPGAWNISTGSDTVIIAILDSGVDLNHPDLSGKLVAGYDFIDDDSIPQDLKGHGTHVAGISAANSNNGVGGAGVAWGARIMPVRVLDASGSGTVSTVVNGINWAYTHGAKILNLSLGGTTNSPTMETAVNNAYAAGSLVIAAAGNCGDSNYSFNGCTSMNQTSYPAGYANTFAVAATTSSDTRSSFSTQASYVDIAAPGSSIYSTYYNDTYTSKDGTSQAAPFVSGLAALIWSVKPGYTQAQVRQVIEATAVDLGTAGTDIAFGAGRINALAALQTITLIAPTLSSISNPENDGNYTINWNTVSSATGYELQEDVSTSFSSPTTRYSGANNQLVVSGQAVGNWYYRVRATIGGVKSAWSNTVSTQVVPSATALAAISNPTSADNYLVDWSDVPGATSYRLEQSPNNTFTSVTVRYIGPVSQYQVTGQAGGTWYYRVFSLAGALVSTASNTVSTTVTASALGVPTLNAISNSDGDKAYTVTWEAVTGATGYRLEQSASSYFDTPTVVYDGALRQLNVTNQPRGRWFYRVRATVAAGDSPWSASRTVVVNYKLYLPTIRK